MKILVTGGAGYLGSVLVQELLTTKKLSIEKVTVVDNFMYGQVPLGHLCWDDYLEIINLDARDTNILGVLAEQHDVVIPLAAIVGAPACARDKIAARTVNIDAIASLMSWINPLNQRVIIPISNSGYGVGTPGEECTEQHPLRPISYYGETKVRAEHAALEHGNTVSLRLATVFGMSPRMRLDLLVNDFVWRAVNDKAVVLFEADFKRNYIHIRDVANAVIHVLLNWGGMKNNIYNVGLSAANLSKRELCKVIKGVVPDFVYLESPIGVDPDKRDYIVSNAKLEATGWRPGYSLENGIRELVRGYTMMRKVQFGNV